MTGFIIFILFAAVLFMSVKIYSVKKQIRNISEQLEKRETHCSYPIFIDFVDKDVEKMAVCINGMLEEMQNTEVKYRKKEAEIKSSIAVISHDMRTPLTSVIGYLQLAERNIKDEENLKNIRIALERAGYCNKLINDFFELSAAESGGYEPDMQKVNISAFLCEQILVNYPNFESKGITPVFEQQDETVYVRADKVLLERVISNLISNCIKHASGTIDFELHDANTDKVALTVSNYIENPVDTNKIFDRLYREDASRSADGSGLGLYICKRFIEDMGGEIFAECRDNMLIITVRLRAWGNSDAARFNCYGNHIEITGSYSED